jgi:hypothetical protein
MISSLVNIPVDLEELPTLFIIALITIALMYFLSGLSAGLFMTYNKALTKSKTSLAEFYAYALHKAPVMFKILLIREFITLLVLVPAIAIYIYFLENIEYMDVVLYIYTLLWIAIIHFVFTPAFLAGGAYGNGLFASLNHAFELIKKMHVRYFGLFVVFAIVWFLNFIPLIQLATLLFAYPVVTTAIIIMMEGTSSRVE